MRSSKAKVCAAHLSQCFHGISLYAADADGVYPAAKDCLDWKLPKTQPKRVQGMPMLVNAVYPYTASTQIFQCPMDTGMHVDESIFPEQLELYPSAYAVCQMSFEYRTELGAATVADTRIENPAGVNLLADLAGHWHGSSAALKATDNFDNYSEQVPDYRYNVLYSDGHVRLVTHDELEGAWRRG